MAITDGLSMLSINCIRCAFGPGPIASRGFLFGVETVFRNWRSERDALSGRASSGKRVPEFGSRAGRAFRLELQTESASRNPRLEWDTLSGSALNRKLRPGIRCQNGICFPNRLQAEIAFHSESSFWDALSARSFVGKMHPSLSVHSGMRFPLKDSTGKHIPF